MDRHRPGGILPVPLHPNRLWRFGALLICVVQTLNCLQKNCHAVTYLVESIGRHPIRNLVSAECTTHRDHTDDGELQADYR